MSKPDFICIGPKRSATTWLADQLKAHRDVWLPPIQELNYLNGAFAQHRGQPYLKMRWTGWEIAKRVIRNKGPGLAADAAFLRTARRLTDCSRVETVAYAELFAPSGKRVTGDISPMYASLEAGEIAALRPLIGDATVILLARDPLARFWSELAMHARKRSFGAVDYTDPGFVRAFFDDPERRKQHLLSGIVARWRDGLGAERLHVLFFDDVVSDPESTLRRIVDLIGADWKKRLPGLSPARNRKRGRAPLVSSPGLRAEVRGWFADELDACADLFGARGAAWRRR